MEISEVKIFAEEDSPLYWANLAAKEDIIVNQGGTYSGKTYSIIEVLITIAVLRSRYVITVTSNTIPKLKDDALRAMKDILSKHSYLKSFITDYNSTERVYTFSNGSVIEFKSFANAEEAKGGKRHILYMNEASRVSFAIFYELQLRTTVRTFVDYNPTVTFWIHDRVINNKIEFPSVKVLRSWHIHNRHATQAQRDKIERIADKETWKAYARGLTGRLKGLIYPNWEEYPDFPWTDGVIWYCDWGFSENKKADQTAAGRIKPQPEDVDYDYVIDETIYARGVPVKVVAETMWAQGYKAGQHCYCDHSEENIREMRLHGIHAFPARKGPGSKKAGILFLKTKKVAYTSRSVNIKMEQSKYRWLEIDGIETSLPVDEFDHHMDGIRYGAHTDALLTGNV